METKAEGTPITAATTKTTRKSGKSSRTAYALWFLGGLFGLHHFYLGRDKRAFLWWATAGFGGIGWMTDVWRIPGYVAEVNEELEEEEPSPRRSGSTTKPPPTSSSPSSPPSSPSSSSPRPSFFRGCSQFLVGNLFGYLALHCLPPGTLEHVAASAATATATASAGFSLPLLPTLPWKEALSQLPFLLFPAFAVLGVHLTGSMCNRQRGGVARSMGVAYAALALWPGSDAILGYVVSAAVFSYNWKIERIELTHRRQMARRRKTWRGFIKRILKLQMAAVVYVSMVTGLIFFNVTIDSEGENITIADSRISLNHRLGKKWKNSFVKFGNIIDFTGFGFYGNNSRKLSTLAAIRTHAQC